jgi:hypothetical protein
MEPEEMTTAEVLEALTKGRADFMRSVEALGPMVSSLPVTEEGWSAKDLVAIAAHHAGDVAGGLHPETPPEYVRAVTERLSLEEWHDRAVRYWKEAPLAEVWAEFDRWLDRLVSTVRSRSDDQMRATDAVPWAGERPLWQIIGRETFLYVWPTYIARMDQARAST